jgi:hypothetical protein
MLLNRESTKKTMDDVRCAETRQWRMGAEEPTWRGGGGGGGEEGAALLLAVALRLRAHGRLIDGLGLVAGGEGRARGSYWVNPPARLYKCTAGPTPSVCGTRDYNILVDAAMQAAAFVAKEAASLGYCVLVRALLPPNPPRCRRCRPDQIAI